MVMLGNLSHISEYSHLQIVHLDRKIHMYDHLCNHTGQEKQDNLPHIFLLSYQQSNFMDIDPHNLLLCCQHSSLMDMSLRRNYQGNLPR